MVYRGLSWGCLLFGLFLFWSSWEIVRFQQSTREIIAKLFIGMMGAVVVAFGLFGLWECWQKGGD